LLNIAATARIVTSSSSVIPACHVEDSYSSSVFLRFLQLAASTALTPTLAWLAFSSISLLIFL